MKNNNFSQRLNQLMNERNLRQIDILNLCIPFCHEQNIKLGRNDISQYVNGKVIPGSEKLLILSNALCVSEAWLLGYTHPKDKNNTFQHLLSYYNQLNDLGKQEAIKRVEELTHLEHFSNEF